MPAIIIILTLYQIHNALVNAKASLSRCLEALNVEAILVVAFGLVELDLPVNRLIYLVAD
jgi:hypothetical protein